MKKLAIVLTLLFSLWPGFARAQDDPTVEFSETFARGIAALTEGRHQEGIDCFTRCLELSPENATCAYNIACGHSLMDAKDLGFEWLGHAIDWGFAMTADNLEHLRTKDVDLANLRGDARFAPLVERAAAMQAKIQAYVNEPFVHAPASAPADQELGLLVVLHDAGVTKQVFENSPWTRVADEMGFVLVAPSATIPLGTSPEQGFTWFDDAEAYAARYWTYEKTITDAVAATRKRFKIDRNRIFVAGEGTGGIVAASIGFGGPGLFKGTIAIEAPLFEPLVKDRAKNAGTMGHAARFLWTRSASFLEGSEITREQYAQHVGRLLTSWGVEHTIETAPHYPRELSRATGSTETPSPEDMAKQQADMDAAYAEMIRGTLRSLLPQAEPATGEPAEAGNKHLEPVGSGRR